MSGIKPVSFSYMHTFDITVVVNYLRSLFTFIQSIVQGRIEKLNAIRFIWDANNYSWDNMYLNLVTYKETHGHYRVNTDDPKLENLLRKQDNQNTSKQSLSS